MAVCNSVVWPKCIFLGDSITQRGFDVEGGYLSILSSRFQRRGDMVGRGFSGYNTKFCLPILKTLFPTPESLQNTAAFFIFLGANDASFGAQKVDLPEYKSNLSAMIAHLSEMQFDRSRVFLINPPPCDENHLEPDSLALGRPFTRTFANTQTYAQACLEVAKAEGVVGIDLFKAMALQENWKSFLIDGLHFARPGAEFCAQILGSVLEPLLPPAQNFPYWRDAFHIDPLTL